MELDSKLRLLGSDRLLHRSRGICFFALALSVWSVVDHVVKLGHAHPPPHLTAPRLFIVGPIAVVWLLATLAQSCKQPQERLFYCVGIVYFVILGGRMVFPMSETTIRICEFTDIALSAIAVALSAAILFWHFRLRTRGPDSQT